MRFASKARETLWQEGAAAPYRTVNEGIEGALGMLRKSRCFASVRKGKHRVRLNVIARLHAR